MREAQLDNILIDGLSGEMALSTVRHRLNSECPFLGLIVTRVPIVFDDRAKTAIVTNEGEFGKVYVAPKFASLLSLAEFTAVILHEFLHPAFGWFERRGSRNSGIWSKAHDYAINDTIDDFIHSPGVTQGSLQNIIAWPKTFAPLLDRGRFGGMAAEQIYDILMAERSTPPSDEDSDPAQGLVGGTQEGDPSDVFGPRDNGQGIVDHTDCLEIASEIHPEGRQRSIERLLVAASAHHQRMKAGRLPGAVEARIHAILHPPIYWVDALHAKAEGHLRDDRRTYARLSRRGMSAGLNLPGRSSKRPTLGIALDTSISNRENLAPFLGVIRQIAETHEASVRLFQVDTAVQDDCLIEDFDTILAEGFCAKGFGGTDFAPLVERLVEGDAPDLLVILTDGKPVRWPDTDEWPCEVFVVYTEAAPDAKYASVQMDLSTQVA